MTFPFLRRRVGDFHAGALAGYGSDDADALACDASCLGLAGGGLLGHVGLLGVAVGGGWSVGGEAELEEEEDSRVYTPKTLHYYTFLA